MYRTLTVDLDDNNTEYPSLQLLPPPYVSAYRHISLLLLLHLHLLASTSTTTSATMMMSMASTLIGMGALSIRSQQGRRSLLFQHILGQTPKNDTNAALPILFIRWQRINAMLPLYVCIASKGKDAIVGLWKAVAKLGFGVFGSSNKG